jgi:hypothetical protein
MGGAPGLCHHEVHVAMERGVCRQLQSHFPEIFRFFMSFQGFDTLPAADPGVLKKVTPGFPLSMKDGISQKKTK